MTWTRRGFLQAFAAVPLSAALLKARIAAHPDIGALPRVGSIVTRARSIDQSAIHELTLHSDMDETTSFGDSWQQFKPTGALTFQMGTFDHVDPGEHLRVLVGGYGFTGLARSVDCEFLHGVPTRRRYFVQGYVIERTIA